MRRVGTALLGCALLGGCGLPTEQGVQRPGPAVERAAQPGDVNVLPPGPRPDDDALAVVAGFVDAQTSPTGDHAVSRQFLAEGVAWEDVGARVFTTRRLDEVSPGVVRVTYQLTGQVRRDGTWLAERRAEVATYELRRSGATWQLTSVPEGLHLSVRDRDRSFRSRSVHFLAAGTRTTRLVAEPVFQPVADDPAKALVERLLAGPSADLAPAVRTAVPPGTSLRSPVTTEGGTVTVDLDEAVQRLGQNERRQLATQLVWTLREIPGFSTLRLGAGGRPLVVDGREEQRRGDVDEQDPDGLPPTVALSYVQDRQLRSLTATGPVVGPGPAGPVPGMRPPLDDVAVSPVGDEVALLTRQGSTASVSTGPLAGPFTTRVRGLRGAGSPSWGSGERGLWLLEQGRVRLLPAAGTALQDVPVEGSGSVTALAVSRDGARVALVRGAALLVGRVEPTPAGPRVAGLRAVAASLTGVVDVAWESATGLVVLAEPPDQQLTPVRVSVDGSLVAPITPIGIVGTPARVAAAAGSPVTVVADGRLFRDTKQGFARSDRGTSVRYPG